MASDYALCTFLYNRSRSVTSSCNRENVAYNRLMKLRARGIRFDSPFKHRLREPPVELELQEEAF